MALRRLSTSSIQTNGKSSKLWDQTTFQSGMFALATVSLTSTASSIVFSGIPANYTHLQLRQLNLNSVANQTIFIRFNGDTGSNYSRHQVGGTGAVTYASGEASQTAGFIGFGSGTTTSGYGAATITDILDYTNTNKYTTVRALSGNDYNGAGQIVLRSTLWMNTAAVASITIYPDTGNFEANSHFALYGIKAG